MVPHGQHLVRGSLILARILGERTKSTNTAGPFLERFAFDVWEEGIFPLYYGPVSVNGKVHRLPLPPPSLRLPATSSSTQAHSTEGPMSPQGVGQKAAVTARPPGPLSSLGLTCHQLLPAEMHGASQQVVTLGFLEAEGFWWALFLFGRPAPVWSPYVAPRASRKPLS